jgi:hypothetical protein
MKLRAVAVALALIGFGTSVAIAKDSPPANRGGERAVKLCHRTGSAARPFRLIRVAGPAVEAHLRHGDLLATSGCTATTTAAP